MNDSRYQRSKINVLPQLPIKGIYYIGQYGTCGYACAARGYLYHYFSLGIPITWNPLYFEDTTLSKEDPYDIVISTLINKEIPDYDVVILHSTPDIWPKFWKDLGETKFKGKFVIGYCTWESDRLPPNWVECINASVNEVWCPSNYNKNVFEQSGVTVNIRVVPHIFLHQNLPSKDKVVIYGDDGKQLKMDKYNFYTIGELNTRKGIHDLLHVFCKTFSNTDKVRLIIKTHFKNYSPQNKKRCEEEIKSILLDYPNHPQVVTIVDNLTHIDILGLHSIGDCYVSLTRSEGFGLTLFDAFNYGKPIIVTGHGGHVDFLGDNYKGYVRYKLGHVNGMEVFSKLYTIEQQWAYPCLEHASELMRNHYEQIKF